MEVIDQVIYFVASVNDTSTEDRLCVKLKQNRTQRVQVSPHNVFIRET
jgi:hypothetical protein